VDCRFPQLIEQVKQEGGVLIYEDEATCKVSGSISRTWQLSGKGNGIEVKFKGCGESAKIFGAVSVEETPDFYYSMAEVFNAETFLSFLKQIVSKNDHKVFIILDNARYHHAILLRDWLESNKDRIELHFLPPYSPEYNVQENVWRLMRRKSTHNRYFPNLKELKETLVRCFCRFEENPVLLSGIIAPYLRKLNGL